MQHRVRENTIYNLTESYAESYVLIEWQGWAAGFNTVLACVCSCPANRRRTKRSTCFGPVRGSLRSIVCPSVPGQLEKWGNVPPCPMVPAPLICPLYVTRYSPAESDASSTKCFIVATDLQYRNFISPQRAVRQTHGTYITFFYCQCHCT